MKLHPILKQVVKKFGDKLHIDELDKNVVHLCESKECLPFAALIIDPEIGENTILLSFNLEYPNSSFASQLTIELMYMANVYAAEPFYINGNGDMFFGEDAMEHFHMSMMFQMDTSIPEGVVKN